MSSSLIHGKYLVAQAGVDAGSSTVITNGTLFQRDGVIEDIGLYEELKSRYDADEIVGGDNFLVIPGLVNSHHHGRGVSTFQLGTGDDCLETWILAGWGRRPLDHYLMTLYTALQMIQSGTTTIMYNHTQTPVSGLEDDIAQIMRAFQDAGMRVAFSLYYRNQNRIVYGDDERFLADLPTPLADNLRQHLSASDISVDDYFTLFQRTYARYGVDPTGKVRVLLSPANVQWNSDDFLQRTKEYAARYNTGIHMHLVESFYQKEYGLRTWGKTPVDHLKDLEFLGPEVSFAHAVWLTDADVDLLAQSGATVCHNASSNLRLKNGIAPVNHMLSRGVNVCMGTDSTGINDDDDMLQEMRLVHKLHRQPGILAPAISSHQVLRMATVSAAMPTFFGNQIGILGKGKRADVALLNLRDIERPYLDPDVGPVDALLHRGKARDVDTVIIDGEVVLRGGRSTKIDQEEVVQEVRDWFSRPPEPSVVHTPQIVQRLMPYVQRFYQDWNAGYGEPHYWYNSRT